MWLDFVNYSPNWLKDEKLYNIFYTFLSSYPSYFFKLLLNLWDSYIYKLNGEFEIWYLRWVKNIWTRGSLGQRIIYSSRNVFHFVQPKEKEKLNFNDAVAETRRSASSPLSISVSLSRCKMVASAISVQLSLSIASCNRTSSIPLYSRRYTCVCVCVYKLLTFIRVLLAVVNSWIHFANPQKLNQFDSICLAKSVRRFFNTW
jgi:hypothetical protein